MANKTNDEKIIEIKAKLLSKEVGRSITPEQYKAIEYRAQVHAEGYKVYAKGENIKKEVINKKAEDIKSNSMKNFAKHGDLTSLVKEYNQHLKDPKKREKDIQERAKYLKQYEQAKKQIKSASSQR